MQRWVATTLAAVLGIALVGCGDDDSALAATERNMAALNAGTIELRLAASAGTGASETGPVGFELEGPFAFDQDTELAVFDLTYTRLLGATKRVTEVRSTGKRAYVTVAGETHTVAEKDLAPLRISDDTSGGIGDLGIAGWFRNEKEAAGKTVDGEATDVVTGDVDVGDMLSDLARIAQSVGGEDQLATLDDGAAERLQKLVRKSSIRLVTTSKTRQLRTLRAVVDFGTRAPAELRKSLGEYADARIEVNLAMKQATKELRVDAP